jgi:hypothetical protein
MAAGLPSEDAMERVSTPHRRNGRQTLNEAAHKLGLDDAVRLRDEP